MITLACILHLGLLGTTAPRQIAPAGFTAKEPQVASGGRTVFVACGERDQVYVLRSEDFGVTFCNPIKLPSSGRLALGMRRGPRIAAHGESVVVSAVIGNSGGGRDGDLVAWRSADGGKTWSSPAKVNDMSGSAREGLHAMASSLGGRFACTWLDLREKGTQIWASISSDGGATWGRNVLVYKSPEASVCQCCHPSVAFGPKGDLYVMFRNWLGGSRDMFLARSIDGALNFEPAQKLGTGTWPLNACPMDGGSLTVDASGRAQTIWRRGSKVYRCVPGQTEVELFEGTQPWMAVDGQKEYRVWMRQNVVFGQASGPAEELGEGTDPVVTVVNGRGLAVWADGRDHLWLKWLGE